MGTGLANQCRRPAGDALTASDAVDSSSMVLLLAPGMGVGDAKVLQAAAGSSSLHSSQAADMSCRPRLNTAFPQNEIPRKTLPQLHACGKRVPALPLSFYVACCVCPDQHGSSGNTVSQNGSYSCIQESGEVLRSTSSSSLKPTLT